MLVAILRRLRPFDENLQHFVRTAGACKLTRLRIYIRADDFIGDRKNLGRHVLQCLLRILREDRAPSVDFADFPSFVISDPYCRRQLRGISDEPGVGVGRAVFPATGRFIRVETRLPVPPVSNTPSIMRVIT